MKKPLLLFLVLFSQSVCSQTMINGKVITATKNAVENAGVSLSEEKGGLVKAYTTTDEQGKYEISYAGDKDSLFIRVSGFNLKTTSRKIANRQQTVNFEVEEENIRLQEVIVKANKIRQKGDTINYLVSAFTDETDRSIGDVLKKLPGIQVTDDGTVYYQNRPINRYYIENTDLLQGRYGIANNNIKATDIASVQVFENHQPIKALKDIEFSERAAINLKLKDSAKGIVAAEMMAGAGFSPSASQPLLSSEIIGMYFSRTIQDLMMYKGDNTGQNVTGELKSHYSDNYEKTDTRRLLKIWSPSQPAIRQQRFLFNDAHIGSVNDLHQVKKDYSLTTNIHYAFDDQQKTAGSLTEFFLPDKSVLKMDEHLKSKQIQNRLNTDFSINANNEHFYLNNALKLAGNWQKESGEALTLDDTVSQKLKNPVYSVSNTFDLIKRQGKRHYKIHSFTGYNRESQSLSIEPLLYKDLFSAGKSDGKLMEDVRRHSFLTRNSVSFGINKFDLRLNFNADLQNLKTDLYAQTLQNSRESADSLRNSLRWNRLEWELRNFYGFDLIPKMTVYLAAPLRYVWLSKNDRMQTQSSGSGYFYIEPYIFLNYQATPLWSLSCMYDNTNNTGGIDDAYTSYVMTSYKDLNRNDGSLYRQRRQNVLLYLSYKKPFTTLFGNLSVNYFHSRANLMDDFVFRGILKIKSSIEQNHTREGFSISGGIGKAIESIRSKISLNAFYTQSRSYVITQKILTKYTSNFISFSSHITTQFGSFAIFRYEMKHRLDKSKIDFEGQDLPLIRTFSQNLKTSFLPLKNLIFTLSAEYYYNSRIQSGSRSMWFGDIEMKYQWKGMDLALDYTNIFNAKQYVSSYHSDITRYYYTYTLRPAEIVLKLRFSLK